METATPRAYVRRNRAFWRKHVDAWRESEARQRDYCREHDIGERQFSRWKKLFREERKQAPTQQPNASTFMPVTIKSDRMADSDAGNINIQLPNGIRLNLPATASGESVAALIKQLAVVSC